MKSVFLNLLVLLIALVALDFNPAPVNNSHASKTHQLAQIPELDIDPFTTPSVRESQKQQNYIADPFIPIVILAHTLYHDRDISFYLPVYELHRSERFHLLI